jgi:hypothetical protein
MSYKNVPKPLAFDYNRQMIWLRKGFVHFLSVVLSVVLLICLIGGATAIGFNNNLSHPDKLESWLVSSKIYDHLVSAILDQAQKSSANNGGSGTISLSDPAVKQAAGKAFSPELLRSSANTILDSNYNWLAGKKARPDFNIDLSSAKQNFAKLVGQYATTHLGNLLVCSTAQLTQIQIPIDPLSVNCRPVTLNPQDEGARVAQEINNNSDFLSDPIITAGSLNQTLKSNQSQPYYQKLSRVPGIYQIGLKLPWILGGLALLSTLGIVFIAPQRRRGVRRVGVVLLEAGLILIAVKFVADTLVNKFEGKVFRGNTLASQLKQSISDLLHQIETQLAKTDLWFGIFFLVVAILIFVILFKTRQRTAKPKTPETFSGVGTNTTRESPQTDASDIRLAFRRRQPTGGTTDLKQMPPKPTPVVTPPPIGKNPPPPKRPRLIQ